MEGSEGECISGSFVGGFDSFCGFCEGISFGLAPSSMYDCIFGWVGSSSFFILLFNEPSLFLTSDGFGLLLMSFVLVFSSSSPPWGAAAPPSTGCWWSCCPTPSGWAALLPSNGRESCCSTPSPSSFSLFLFFSSKPLGSCGSLYFLMVSIFISNFTRQHRQGVAAQSVQNFSPNISLISSGISSSSSVSPSICSPLPFRGGVGPVPTPRVPLSFPIGGSPSCLSTEGP